MEIKARLATIDDAQEFASWAINNSGIPDDDIKAVAKATPLTIVVEVDGKPELYIPLIPSMTIGYLGFRPDQDLRTRATALKGMLEAVQSVQADLSISSVYVHTHAEYPMGKWATKNGFVKAPKETFVLEKA
jgi:hypothetical protein